MSGSIRLSKHKMPLILEVPLTSSKSESNRALLIDQLAGGMSKLKNLSTARDTQTMQRLLASDALDLDVLDAGTVMRFLTAFLAVGNDTRRISGTERMCKRPIKTLVEALNKLGADIKYLKEEGFPPLEFQPFVKQKTNQLTIPGHISSQYISALLMIAPTLPDGLNLNLTGEIYSRPYIDMTLNLMGHFGVKGVFEGNKISVVPQHYQASEYTIEADWSGASYWYSLTALAEQADITLMGLRKKSNQGDSAIATIMEGLGVKTEFVGSNVKLIKSSAQSHLSLDFKPCPDLAQTVMACAAAKGISLEMTGLESLRIKETDRIAAMATELAKIGARLEEDETGIWTMTPGAPPVVSLPTEAGQVVSYNSQKTDDKPVFFNTYDDHRMAMALAPLCMLFDVVIDDPDVVAKSYPGYWEHLRMAGVQLQK